MEVCFVLMGNHNPGVNHVNTAADKVLDLVGILTCVRTKVNVTLQFIHAKEVQNAKSKPKNFCTCLIV